MEFAVSSNNRVKSLWVKWCERQMLLAQDWELCLPDEKKGGGLRPVPMYSRLSQLGVKDGQTLYTRKRCPIVVKDEEADDVIKIGSTLPPHTANGTASAKAIGKRKASEDEISEGRSRSWSRSPARARRRLDLERTETEDQPRAKPEQTSSPAPSTSPFTERARKRRSATYDLLLDNGLTSELTPRPRPRYVHAWSSGEGESEPEEERDEIEEALADANGVVDAAEKDGEETNGAVDASRKEAGEANATLPAREGSDVPLQSLASSTRPRTTLPLGGRPTDIRKAPNVDLAYDSLEEGELPQSSKAVPKAVPNTNSKIHTKSATNSNTRANASTDAKMSTSTNANTNTNTNTTNNSSANTNTSSDTNANMNMNTSMSAKPSTTTNAPITTTNMSASTRPSTTTNTGTNPGTNTSTILSAQPSAQPNAKPNAKQTPKQVPVPGSRRKRRCGIACDQINYNWGGDAWAEEWFIKEMQPNKRSVAALTTLKAISQDTMWKPGCGTPAGEMPGWLKILIEQKIRARS